MGTVKGKKRILFLCTGNSCRSQMAEGWLRHLAGGRAEVLSAGARPAGFVHPLAVQVMAEVGIDISNHESKSILRFVKNPPDLVISVCDSAAQECPAFPGRVARELWPFEDPTFSRGTEEFRLQEFRRTRDLIRDRIQAELERILK
ncbi:MAG: arsenate reductase ArsC [Planctomycetes bacterium]|nr:arsenate reductase ArsC [Planctomycetota bacterium]